MTCDACHRPANEVSYAGAQRLCAACYDAAKAANQSRDDIPPCAECGGQLVRRPEEHAPLNGMFFLDCAGCDRTYAAFVGEAVRPWHDYQPLCPCGHYARYHSRVVRPGLQLPGQTLVYKCRHCGQRIEVYLDRDGEVANRAYSHGSLPA